MQNLTEQAKRLHHQVLQSLLHMLLQQLSQLPVEATCMPATCISSQLLAVRQEVTGTSLERDLSQLGFMACCSAFMQNYYTLCHWTVQYSSRACGCS